MMPPVVELDRVSVSLGGTTVLSELSLSIYPGERILLEGENGVGKTTLIKTALGFIQPRSGRVVMEEALSSGHVAYLPQSSIMSDLPISVEEVVGIGLLRRRLSRRERAAKTAHLLEALDCGALVGRSYATLSGGEKQRVSLARCLAQAPRLLVLDEPNSGLDAETRRRFYPLLEATSEVHGATVLMISHNTADLSLESWRRLRLVRTAGESRIEELS